MKKYKLLFVRTNYIVYIKKEHYDFVLFLSVMFSICCFFKLLSLIANTNFEIKYFLIIFSILITIYILAKLRFLYLTELEIKNEDTWKEIFFIPKSDRILCWCEKGLFSKNKKYLDVKNYMRIRETDDCDFEKHLSKPIFNKIEKLSREGNCNIINNYFLNAIGKSVYQTRDLLISNLITSEVFSNNKNEFNSKYFNLEKTRND